MSVYNISETGFSQYDSPLVSLRDFTMLSLFHVYIKLSCSVHYISFIIFSLLSYSDVFYLLIIGVDCYCSIWSYSMIHTLGRAPLDEGSTPRIDLYLTTHKIHKRRTPMTPGWIRTRNPLKRASKVLSLRPRRHRDRPVYWCVTDFNIKALPNSLMCHENIAGYNTAYADIEKWK